MEKRQERCFLMLSVFVKAVNAGNCAQRNVKVINNGGPIKLQWWSKYTAFKGFILKKRNPEVI